MDHLPAKLPFSKRRLRPRIIISYILDYVIVIALIIGFAILNKVEPFHQPFSLENISLKYPYAVHERVPMVYALCISGLFPLVLIAVYTLFIDGLFSHNKPQDPVSGKRKVMGPYRWKDRLWEFNCGFLGLLLAQCLAFVITQALKNACGKPRPDIIDRCKPRVDYDPTNLTLATYEICQDKSLLTDGFRSWPSGHSSSSFAGLFYTSLWLGGKLHIMDNRGEVWKTILCMLPLLAATLVAVSRIMDARHHPFDVITGSLLGVACGWVSYRQYFPSLGEPWKKGRAYPIRTWGAEPMAPADATRLISHDESITALRNLDEEQTNAPGIPQGSGALRNRSVRSPPAYSSNPFASNMDNHRQHDDGNYSSSSEDVADGYEMQHGYSQAQNPGLGGQFPRYDLDTSYHSTIPGVTAIHTPPEAMTVPTHHQGRTLTDAPSRVE